MKMSKFENIWSTPFGQYFLEDAALQHYIIELINRPVGNIGNTFDFLEDADKSHPFIKWLYTCAEDYLSKFYPNHGEIEIQRAWVSTQLYGDNTDLHSHNPVDFVGVYYINCEPDHPELIILDPRPPHWFNEVKTTDKYGITHDGSRHISVKPEPYKLIMFPGYLMHGVGINMSQIPRHALAVNFKIKR